jgi:hypothetical protein
VKIVCISNDCGLEFTHIKSLAYHIKNTKNVKETWDEIIHAYPKASNPFSVHLLYQDRKKNPIPVEKIIDLSRLLFLDVQKCIKCMEMFDNNYEFLEHIKHSGHCKDIPSVNKFATSAMEKFEKFESSYP